MGLITRMLERVDRQSTLMGGMMDRLGVDIATHNGDLYGNGFERAMRACTFCGHGEECQSWQDAHAEGADRAPAFCPNAAFWAARR